MASSPHRTAWGLFLLTVLFWLQHLTTVQSQATGLVTISDRKDFVDAGTPVKECLWLPGHRDVAYSIGCPTQTVYNFCFCPTNYAALSTVSSALTGCLTYWYSQTGALAVQTAVSIYNSYCTQALGLGLSFPIPPLYLGT